MCPDFSQSSVGNGNQSNCICNAGYTGMNGGTCIPCAAGKYKMAPGSSECSLCGIGKYSTTVAASAETSCISCGIGKYSITLPAISETSCLNCVQGKYSTTVAASSQAHNSKLMKSRSLLVYRLGWYNITYNWSCKYKQTYNNIYYVRIIKHYARYVVYIFTLDYVHTKGHVCSVKSRAFTWKY